MKLAPVYSEGNIFINEPDLNRKRKEDKPRELLNLEPFCKLSIFINDPNLNKKRNSNSHYSNDFKSVTENSEEKNEFDAYSKTNNKKMRVSNNLDNQSSNIIQKNDSLKSDQSI